MFLFCPVGFCFCKPKNQVENFEEKFAKLRLQSGRIEAQAVIKVGSIRRVASLSVYYYL